jgi:DNA-binding NtrC family response regulator
MTPAPPSLLVVDDEEPVLTLIERVGHNSGFDVMTCTNGSDAVHMLARKPADLAMVDLCMPDVNGLDLLRDIRRAVPGCEVILMTGHAGIETAVEAMKRGAREYLTKPFDFDRLRKVLADIRGEILLRAQVVALEGGMPPPLLRDVERGHIVDTLRRVNGNRMAAAKLLGISRRALYRRLDRHHITDLA